MQALFAALADVLDGPLEIEKAGRAAILSATPPASCPGVPTPLPNAVLDVMAQPNAHPACALVRATPLPWAPPETSPDPLYKQHSGAKVHVELLGPNGVAHSDRVRLGLYGILPGAEYGLRTHPAEEVFVMMAGSADWMQGDQPYAPLGAGERSFHPSMMPHATRTGDSAFMSVYVWSGDVSTKGYVYHGIPNT